MRYPLLSCKQYPNNCKGNVNIFKRNANTLMFLLLMTNFMPNISRFNNNNEKQQDQVGSYFGFLLNSWDNHFPNVLGLQNL